MSDRAKPRIFRSARKWAVGLIPLALLWLLAVWNSTVAVEETLAGQGKAAVKDMVLEGANVIAEGRDLRLSANAFSLEGRSSALAAVEAVSGVRLVNDATGVVPEAKPFVWTADRDVVRVTLGGNVPLPASRARIMDAARADLPGTDVVDRMNFARGAPPRFEAAANLLIDQVARLKEAKIAISDTTVKLAGLARDIGGREAIAAALKNLPDGFTVGENTIAAPPYFFQVNKDPVATTLTLSGYVPDNSVHAAIVDAIGRKFAGDKIVDNLKASAGAPQGFTDSAMAALSGLSRLSTGTLVMSERDISLTGDAFYDAAAEKIRGGLGLPQGWTYKADISTRPPASPVDGGVCQQLFGELLGKDRIRFDSGSAVISQDSAGLLDRLISVSQRCPNATIEIAGHTDSDGKAEANLVLSQRRAMAVVAYLTDAGIASERLSAAGYGSEQPLGANDTPEGKAQNRRIDFVVK